MPLLRRFQAGLSDIVYHHGRWLESHVHCAHGQVTTCKAKSKDEGSATSWLRRNLGCPALLLFPVDPYRKVVEEHAPPGLCRSQFPLQPVVVPYCHSGGGLPGRNRQLRVLARQAGNTTLCSSLLSVMAGSLHIALCNHVLLLSSQPTATTSDSSS